MKGITCTKIAASAVALMAAEAASAQDRGAAATAPQGIQAGDQDSGIGDIVVTAQKRSESLQKTPAAVTAILGERLVQAGITQLPAIQMAVPGARFHQEGNSTQVFLRGVGANLDFGNIDQAVAFNFNGIYMPREATSVPLFDLERVEILPGPQGTLYGRSAIGGTINVSFRRPTREQETSGTIEVGNYSLGHATLVENLPLSPDLAVRAGVDYTYRKGFMESGADSRSDLAARIGVLYDHGKDLSVYLWGSMTQKYGHPANLVNKGFDLATGSYREAAFLRDRPWDDLRTGALAALAPFGPIVRPDQKYRNYTVGAQIDVGLGGGVTLSYIPGYVYVLSQIRNYWLGAIPTREDAKYDQITQELRFAGQTAKLNWLVGLFGYRTVNSGQATILYRTPLATDVSHVLRNRIEGVAIFGQATYSLSDVLRLTAGGRFGRDDHTGRGVSVEDGTSIYAFSDVANRFDYKAGVEYDVADQIMLYATYQTGYTPATYNEVVSRPDRPNRVNKATLRAVTAGFKARFFDNRLQVNDEVFFYDYRDLFIQAYDINKAFNPIFNAKKVTIPGNQLDVVFKPSRDDTLRISVGYLHARNKNFTTPSGGNFNGGRPPYAADWTVSGGVSHDFQLTAGYLRAEASARYESEWFADYVPNKGVRQKPYAKVDAALTYFPRGESWSAGVWIKNATNEAVLAATAAAGIPGPATANLDQPRTFGGRVTFKY